MLNIFSIRLFTFHFLYTPPGGIEPPRMASEANALSTELWGLYFAPIILGATKSLFSTKHPSRPPKLCPNKAKAEAMGALLRFLSTP
jgi:hypothetical protein